MFEPRRLHGAGTLDRVGGSRGGNCAGKGGLFRFQAKSNRATVEISQLQREPACVHAVPSSSILADRAEFVESLQRLRNGHVLVRTGDNSCGCVLDGAIVYRSFPPLVQYGLIDEFDNPAGFPGVQYFRITPRGRDFAQRAWEQWRHRSVWERLLVRLVG